MAITWINVGAIAPRLASMDVISQSTILAIANSQINTDAWGDLADAGATYLAAHLATLALRSGLVTQEAVGQISRTYNTVKGINGSLGLTAYGAEYLRLVMLLPTSLGAVF